MPYTIFWGTKNWSDCILPNPRAEPFGQARDHVCVNQGIDGHGTAGPAVHTTKSGGKWLPASFVFSSSGMQPTGVCPYAETYETYAGTLANGHIIGYGAIRWECHVSPGYSYVDAKAMEQWSYDIDLDAQVASYEGNYESNFRSITTAGCAQTADYFLFTGTAGPILSPLLPGSLCAAPASSPLHFVDPQQLPSWPGNANTPFELATGTSEATGIAADGTSLAILVAQTTNQDPVTFQICPTACANGIVSDLSLGGLLTFSAFAVDGSAQFVPQRPSVQDTPRRIPNTPPGTYYAFALYRAPPTFPVGANPAAPVPFNIGAVHGGSTSEITRLVWQPPLLLVHGIWSDGQEWSGLESYLAGRYASVGVTRVDYSAHASEPFAGQKTQDLFHVWLSLAIAKARRSGTISTRVDVVGHSMGGLVTRAFADPASPRYMSPGNYNQGNIYRLITVGTPHKGTPFANFVLPRLNRTADAGSAWAVFPSLTLGALMRILDKDPSGGGLAALQTNSPSILALPSTLRYRAIRGVTISASAVGEGLNALLTSYDGIPASLTQTSLDNLLLAGHDTVVPYLSQGDGAIATVDIQGLVHSDPVIEEQAAETRSKAVFQQVLCWLTEGASCAVAVSSVSGIARRVSTTSVTSLGDLDFANMTEVAATEFSLSPDPTSPIPLTSGTTVTVASAGARAVTRAAFFHHGVIEDVTVGPFSAQMAPRSLSPLELRVIVLFADNTYAKTTVTYSPQDASTPVAVLVDPPSLLLPWNGASLPINPSLLYPDGLVGIRDQAVIYTVRGGGANIVTVSSTGVVTATGPGTTFIDVTFGGVTGSVPVTVTDPCQRPPSVSNNGPICAGQTLQLSASTVPNGTHAWTGPNGFSSTEQNPAIPGATALASGDYNLAVTAGNCTSSYGTTTVSVSPTPGPPTASNNGPLCAGQTLQLNASTVAGATYSWTGPNGFTSTQQDPSITNVTSANTGTYSVSVTLGGCASPVATTTVVMAPDPPTPNISAPATVSSGASGFVASVADHVGSSYTWTIINGSITSGQGTTQITFTAGATGSVMLAVRETNASGCSSTPAGVVIPIVITGAGFSTLVPCRIVDTRGPAGPYGLPPLTAGGVRTFHLAGHCGVPAGAAAVSVNVTVTGPAAEGLLRLYSSDQQVPNTSTISFKGGQTRANNAIVAVSSDGKASISVHNASAGTVYFILDVNGYFH